MTDNVNLTQEVTHIGTDHITITYGGDATHNSSSVTKSFNVSKADLGTVHVENFPEYALKNNIITFRVYFTDIAGYNPFEIDDFTMVILLHGQSPYTENNATTYFSSDRTNGYAEISLTVGNWREYEELVLSIGDSTHYNRKTVSLGTVNIVESLEREIELDCTTSIDDWLPCLTTPAIKTLDGSSCLMIQCNRYDWTLAGYIFDITKTYTLHTELHLNNRNNGYIRLGFIDNYDTLNVNNAHIIEYTNENGFKWNKVTRTNGNDTLVSTALQGKQIKYNAWTDVDFIIIEGEIYASYTTSSGEEIVDEYIGTMDYDFCFAMSSWISNYNGMGCRKFVVTEILG